MADTATNTLERKKKALLKALENSLGVVTEACREVGIGRTAFYKYLNEDPEFAAAVKDIDEVALDFAEGQLYKQIREGSTVATIFYLKTKGKKRGYVERQEISGPEGSPIKMVDVEKLSTSTAKELLKQLKSEDTD